MVDHPLHHKPGCIYLYPNPRQVRQPQVQGQEGPEGCFADRSSNIVHLAVQRDNITQRQLMPQVPVMKVIRVVSRKQRENAVTPQ